MVAWVGSACTSACGIVVGRGKGGGGCFAVIFQCGSKRRVRVYPDVCFALSSLVSGNQKHKFEIDRDTLFELTLILSLN